jgi:hypothetical protein
MLLLLQPFLLFMLLCSCSSVDGTLSQGSLQSSTQYLQMAILSTLASQQVQQQQHVW